MNKYIVLTLAVAALGLSACSSERVSNFPSYKLKVEQGNELDPQRLAQLQAGMTREQVRLLLGTPSIRSAFHANRWDYQFAVTRNGITQENHNLTVYFDGDVLSRAEGSALNPAEKTDKP
ncbi:outer membrane protein assembly factor BamE [Vitreoscilla stercoraria]|uniref:Outer membrane protein assembly factor BamE n=1 Tax=Vitreoscilla stercoraria TaxID=61 RepID=A0ABY4EAJ0_VITST|nr:outer membrane protein assembly factor BamE [Vitreoscilla stercoraria]UOO91563.1 outer membrane protein assembly factor BamE [Vitreoscilla stercoraria]